MTLWALAFIFLAGQPASHGSDTGLPDPARSIYHALLREMEQGRNEESWRMLQEARARVRDPLFARPVLPSGLGEVYGLFLRWYLLWLVVVVGGGVWLACRLWSKQSLWQALGWAGVWLAILLASYLLVRGESRPFAVMRLDATPLRQGNGISYPVQVHQGLPIRLGIGVEALVVTERDNGWVQIALPGGRLGWVPRDAVYLSHPSR